VTKGAGGAVEMGLKRHEAAMPRFLLLAGIVLLIADYSFAQDSPDPTPMQCQLIRLAVAQYGFAAARRHALETYWRQMFHERGAEAAGSHEETPRIAAVIAKLPKAVAPNLTRPSSDVCFRG
jgi:hypothetical protein